MFWSRQGFVLNYLKVVKRVLSLLKWQIVSPDLELNPYSLWWGFSLIAADTSDIWGSYLRAILGAILRSIFDVVLEVIVELYPLNHDYYVLKVMYIFGPYLDHILNDSLNCQILEKHCF
jgi:hypothetical protein